MASKVSLDTMSAPRLLEPGPVALVTSRHRSADNVMTAAWMMPASLQPPLVALAIYPERLTHEFVSQSEYFALNIPTADLLGAVHRCGVESGRDGDKFTRSGLTPTDAAELDLPLVEECVAHIECGVVERVVFGDHDLFIGHPVAVSALDEAFSDRWLVEVDAGQVLHHLRAEYYASLSRSYRVSLEEED